MAAMLTELVLDRAHNAVIWLDERGVVTYWNPSSERVFGISRDEALGRAVADLIIPERFRAAHHAGFQRFSRREPDRCWIDGSRWRRCTTMEASSRSR